MTYDYAGTFSDGGHMTPLKASKWDINNNWNAQAAVQSALSLGFTNK